MGVATGRKVSPQPVQVNRASKPAARAATTGILIRTPRLVSGSIRKPYSIGKVAGHAISSRIIGRAGAETAPAARKRRHAARRPGGAHELQNLHRPGGAGLDFSDLLRPDDHKFALAVFVALHHFIAADHLPVFRADELLLQPGVVGAMQQVKRNGFAPSAARSRRLPLSRRRTSCYDAGRHPACRHPPDHRKGAPLTLAAAIPCIVLPPPAGALLAALGVELARRAALALAVVIIFALVAYRL